jgi:hypothetical protein
MSAGRPSRSRRCERGARDVENKMSPGFRAESVWAAPNFQKKGSQVTSYICSTPKFVTL